jgi:hypothetical protein
MPAMPAMMAAIAELELERDAAMMAALPMAAMVPMAVVTGQHHGCVGGERVGLC